MNLDVLLSPEPIGLPYCYPASGKVGTTLSNMVAASHMWLCNLIKMKYNEESRSSFALTTFEMFDHHILGSKDTEYFHHLRQFYATALLRKRFTQIRLGTDNSNSVLHLLERLRF